ncbi:MAG: class I SAM-dependent methyltransferase [Gemmatimonadota bacterium]|nr:class I SAM-dependent methyltransferase [Gemmatimonadota bacterium]
MTRRTLGLSEELREYVLEVSVREPEVLRRLREETAGREGAAMQIAPEQGQFLRLLVKAVGAARTLEIGVFTGYSAAVTALALPPGGRVVACEIDEGYAAIAREWWRRAGVDGKIDLRIGPALDTLDALLDSGGSASFDFAFVDAAKEEYLGYWERCLRLLRPGGLIAVDNVLWDGRVADPENREASTEAIRAFNARVADDERVDLSLVPIGDGVTLARVRESAVGQAGRPR